jgi:hypothetical protein
MSCCGQRRETQKAWLRPRPVLLRFLGTGELEIKGNVTGRPYTFSDIFREVSVDPRDANGLLRNVALFMLSEPR